MSILSILSMYLLILCLSKINFNEAVTTVFCDLTKAFDRVNYAVLLQTFAVYEIKDELVKILSFRT